MLLGLIYSKIGEQDVFRYALKYTLKVILGGLAPSAFAVSSLPSFAVPLLIFFRSLFLGALLGVIGSCLMKKPRRNCPR